MNWLSLLGLQDTLDRLRSRVGEGAIAVEDRLDLLAIEWQQQKKNLLHLTVLCLVVAGLTVVALTMLSGAVIIAFWDTPNRLLAALVVAALWLLLWVGALIFLVLTVKRATSPFPLTKRVLQKDWAAVKRRL